MESIIKFSATLNYVIRQPAVGRKFKM